ncbi:HPF/RaiA family ribosome-associated protein [Pseudonocardia acidicola]|uniref:HPF/RaiA family ribosome-associated protein n=1 Tax=Pseudonocardia acidicola TaxID=2724939 RepID=A0ABX1SEC3_9PSEU|nr:HPF/RaiA family ribosome-associated protein [Pseudonocardia acidicola]NMH99269.1 HPF/RaiA family ribosome-associated protein [Pseudonocardia acidicola]
MRGTEAGIAPAEIVVELPAEVAPDLADHVRERIGAALAHSGQPALHVRVRVVRHGDPARQQPVTAQVNVDLNGRFMRVQSAAGSPREAVDRLVGRLEHRLERVALDWEARRRRVYHRRPHEWQHDAPPTQRKPYFPRPPEEREIVRHKTIGPARCSIDQAVADMNDLDHEFHLFVEDASGLDSVVYRAGPTGVRLAQVDVAPDRIGPYTVPLTISSRPAPLLDLGEAVERLRLLDLPFLFFLDADHGRASLLYRRYDGHYGLVDPPDAARQPAARQSL